MPGALIRGTVSDLDGNPLENARVWIAVAPVPVPEVANLTDAGGGFAIAASAAGRYEIAVAAAGYQSSRISVEVEERDSVVETSPLRLTPS